MATPTGKDLTNRLQNQTVAPVGNNFNDVMRAEMAKSFKAIKAVVPSHVTPERMARIALTTISRTPDLAKCTPASIIGAVMNCAVMGLEPNLIGHAYLVPFYNKKIGAKEAQFVIGYKGLIDLVRRTGDVSNIYAHEVCEQDKFDYCYGLKKDLFHKPAEGDRGNVTHYYACYHLKDGASDFVVMTKAEVAAHRDKYSKAASFGPWVENFDEMAKKTCIRRLVKFMPISIEIQEHIATDEAVLKPKKEDGLDSDDIFDVEYAVVSDEPTPPAAEQKAATSEVKNGKTQAAATGERQPGEDDIPLPEPPGIFDGK